MDRLAQDNNDHEDLLNRMVLKDLMEGLEEEQREIILRRYFYNETQTQIAGELGISQVQVSRLEKRILKEMRKNCKQKALWYKKFHGSHTRYQKPINFS